MRVNCYITFPPKIFCVGTLSSWIKTEDVISSVVYKFYKRLGLRYENNLGAKEMPH